MAKYPKVNYIGNKEKLVNWIISEMPVKNGTVLDIFAGGCSVAYALKQNGYHVIANDVLFADYVIAKALVENQDKTLSELVFQKKVSEERIQELVDKFRFIQERLYYPNEIEDLAKLVAISEKIKGNERFLFLALLRRAMIRKLPYSRMNVPWNQIQKLRDEEYSYAKYGRKRAYHNQTFESHMLENLEDYNQSIFKGNACKAYHCDAIDMVQKIDYVDVVYMDPPYPSTMNNYDAFYGIYDEMFEKKKQHIDFTQRSTFLKNINYLIHKLIGKTEYLVLSQNTRVQPRPEEIRQLLEQYGVVQVKERKHNYQVTGKENKNSSNELLFILHME